MAKIQRIDKILANSGYGSRKQVRRLIKDGAVRVDGVAVKEAGMHVDPEKSIIEIDGDILNYREFIYIMMNKPAGVISATYDSSFETVIDLLDEQYRHFNPFPVGRLDIDTEGLLLITNDGKLAHKLLSPKNHVPKKYYALVKGDVTGEDVREFENGVILDDGYKTMPAKLTILRTGVFSEVEVVVFEGKFHLIKRMFDAAGKKVKYLKRIEMGGLKLDNRLKPGDYRELSSEEIVLLKRAVNRDVE